MRPMMRYASLIATALLATFLSLPALAAVCNTAASGNWNAQTTWGAAGVGCVGATGGIPGAADSVTIGATHAVTLTASAAAASITVAAATAANGVTLNGYSLNVGGAVTMTAVSTNNITSTFNVGAGTLAAASIAINGGASNRVALMTVSSGTITTTGNISFGGTAGNARFTSTGASMVNVGGNFGSGGTLTAGAGTINLNGAAGQTLGAYTTYNNVTIAKTGGTATLAGAVTVGGTLNLNSGNFNVGTANFAVVGPTNITGAINQTSATGTASFRGLVTVNPGGSWSNTSNEAVDFWGGITNNGTFSGGSGTQTFSTNSQALGGANAMSFDGGVTVAGAFVLTNNNVNTVSISGVLNGTVAGSTWVNAAGSTLNYGNAANPMATGIFTASANPNTVNFSLAGAQNIKVPTGNTYHHLTLSGTSAKTALAGLTVNGNLTMSGSATFNTANFTHNFLGNWVVNTTAATPMAAAGSTINFNTPGVPAATSISGTTAATLALAAVNINNTSGVSVSNNLSASGNLTVAAGATLTPAAGNIISGVGTLTGSGTVKVTRTAATADFSSQYTISNKTLTNLTVEYAGTAAQTVSALTYGGLTINNTGATLASGTTTVSGTLTLAAGALTLGANTLALNGPAIAVASGTLTTSSTSNLSFGGSSSGVYLPGSVLNLNNLTLNNASGLSLNSSPAIAGTLTLTSGAISTGSYILETSANCPASVARTSGFVAGNLRLTFPSNSTTTCTYHVGSGTNYAPIGVTMVTTLLGGGTLTGSTTGNEHPQIASSSIDPTRDANRHWTLWATGDTVTASSYGATLNFAAGDLDIGATPTSFVVGRYTVAGGWTLPTPITVQTATATGVSGIAGPIGSVTDFAVGQVPEACTVPTDIATWAAAQSPVVALSCVCDNFGRANLNPSTIYGQNWLVSASDTTGILPSIVNPGYLRLTNNTGNNAKAATVPGTFPAAGNVIFAEFKHYAYNGTIGADGIALTLSDALQASTPGAFGGSLGYAQKCQNGVSGCVSDCNVAGGCPGFTGGWAGIAIDEYGNYSNNTEGRTGGPAPGLTLDSVSVRGSGSGQTGYPYLAGSSTLTPGIDNAGSTTVAYGHRYRIKVDARDYANSHTWFSVERDTTGSGSSYASVVPLFDVFAANPSQSVVPQSWKLSFTGSTGGSTNIHEISGLKICAQAITPPAGYLIQVDNLSPSSCGTPGGNPASPIVTVRAVDAIGNTIANYTGTVNLAATLSGGAASAAVWSVMSANGTLTGNQYTFVVGDGGVARFYLTDASSQDVYLAVTEIDGSPSTSLATPVQYRGGSFSVAITDALGSGVVAGRSHQMSITRTNCGTGTDTTYIGAKPLDGWYSPTTGDHPDGANAPQICNLNGSNSCLPAAGSTCSTLSIAPPALSAGSNNLTLSFTLGVANFCLVTSDVGKYSLGLRDDSNILSPINGSSATLTARPFALAVSGIKQGATPNPGESGNGGARFITAGDSFEATVGAYLWNSAVDANYDGVPDGGATLAGVIANGTTPHYAWPTILAAGAPYVPAAGTLNNGSLSFTNGLANPVNLDYPEVGSFTISAGASNFLNTAGLNLSGLIFNAAGSQTSGVVGRFYPHHFVVSSTLAPACSSGAPFTYEDQPFNIFFTLQAQNKNNVQTYNYGVTGYAPVATGVLSLVAEDNNGGQNWLSPRVAWTPPALIWTNGAFTSALSVPVTFSRAASADGPFNNWALGLKLVDNSGDGVPLQSDMNAATVGACAPCDAATLGGAGFKSRMLYGRLLIDNAYGSELLNLPVSLTAQYWNGSAYAINTDDVCTSIASENFSYVQGGGATITTTVKKMCTGTCTAGVCSGTGTCPVLTGGTGRIALTKPSPVPASKGSVLLNSNLTWLPGSGQETFGIYKSKFIYLREMY